MSDKQRGKKGVDSMKETGVQAEQVRETNSERCPGLRMKFVREAQY